MVALIVRTIDSDLYHRFVRGEVSDLAVVDTVFERAGTKTLQRKHEGYLFEATIIVSAQEDATRSADALGTHQFATVAAVCRSLAVEAKESDNASGDPDLRARAECHRNGRTIQEIILLRSDREGLDSDIQSQRLELLSASLIDEQAMEHENS